jgi:hypothetical protein
LVPEYDPLEVTHIVTDATEKTTLKALGLKSLPQIPEHIPIVKWSWVIAGRKVENYDPDGRVAEDNATFPSRIFDPNWEWKKKERERKEKEKGKAKEEVVSEGPSDEISRISYGFSSWLLFSNSRRLLGSSAQRRKMIPSFRLGTQLVGC